MTEDEYKQIGALEDRQLYDFVTEIDSSQRKWVAIHLLEQRRNAALVAASKSSARAAWLAAAIAGGSAIIAVLAFLQAS